MMVTPAEEENNIEVRREDQNNINKFARLNARVRELRDERKIIKQSLERLDDASTELMMSSDGDDVMLLIGESFFDTSEEDATEYCEAEVERMTDVLETLNEEESTLIGEQAELKKILYGRFGKSIQLEEKV
uniref:Prefoldin subunit 4 n=1 Tax=Pseudo-nitzschia australis TaxID=44445 RepID=A0A7S4A977_9STRA|mmetsp:Transcript_9570/g.20706  ORF Transcript_9570/g.20706 Transcript_9570/m.20706 type:complete len:132 (+) Transcript_9570:218-613(+)|eukprot:CAMPEP_0168183858 /NCGR_PEP_ID=MMETSP0139_2-20121125/12858_1 /TAXON_ID=44445 /ORGANISM="Pseudo-nitzschia australis, Strain 10249 10 AB" /LENGTH=131 /DNA_ID=CAMNT_0008105297 /DNA_START=135 /DNA_END=530 /DNA_ORIENTATION=-